MRRRQTPLIALALAAAAHPNAQPAEEQAPAFQPTQLPPAEGETGTFDQPTLPPPDHELGADQSEIDLLFEDFDVVVTASRSEQSVALSPVPVSILDADDIRFSGVREVQELLAFVPGVDAFRIGRNQWAIGVRGLHQVSSDRTLLLVNGRNASNPIFGGFDLQRQPIFLHDIARIEVVRGPAGGAWGANAFNGVINIIEKNPRDTTGVFLSQRLNEFGDTRTTARFGDATDDYAWRLSTEFEEYEATGTPIGNDGTGVVVAPARDFARTRKFAYNGLWDVSSSTSLDLGIAYAHTERGSSPFLNQQFLTDDRIDFVRSHTKLLFNEGDPTNGYIQWHGTFQDTSLPSQYRHTAYDNAFEGQVNFSPADGHAMSAGATLRLVNAAVSQDRATDAIPAQTVGDQWAGAFLSDRWTINDRWTFEGQARVDWYSQTEVDWAARLALLRKLDDEGRHVLRIAGARAFRTPQTAIQDLSSARVPIAPGLFGFNIIDPATLDNEHIYSAEIGYTGRVADVVTFRADAYYQHYNDLTQIFNPPEPPPVVGRLFASINNASEANAYGTEIELTVEQDQYEFSAWYAYNEFDITGGTGFDTRAFLPAKHKAGLSGRLHIDDQLTLNANYRYAAESRERATVFESPDSHRLDLAATIALPRSIGEFQFGVLDALDQTDKGYRSVSSPGLTQFGLGQSFFAELRIEF